ncbi:MBL fold metallo-hydrolase [Aquimarina sp. 2201CG14-23]|uniref:MBL fold metallo-hydrolase n=1 Tax=Aquimarina mycalae TaxID=3040073 RepID=UPI00247814A6|nr:MBL fold metallo-hydrolase [Aquimarina sp. 2201CG14-23]MDH7447146.1 MBL fold metallo-hydrolase [Aquimarina sp. 2201CG14-23]
MLKRLFLLTLLFSSIFTFSQKKLSFTYIGNIGVYITDGQSSVLIDGLHTEYGDDYLFPPSTLIDKIQTKLLPDGILFTHYHGDHFSALLSNEYLNTNKKAILLGSNQITKEIKHFKDRVFTISTINYDKQVVKLKNIEIKGLKINHVGKRHISVENVGYLVDFGIKKVLHVGDTNWMEEINLFSQLDLVNEHIDIAVLPYWMLLDNNATMLIKKHINPKHIIATHISPRINKQELQDMKVTYPDVYFLNTLEQQIQL